MRKVKTLKLNYEFKNVLNKGKYFVSDHVVIYILKNKFSYNRFGIAVSTKAGKAVKRNRIKRVIREAYYLYMNYLDLADENFDIVVMWNKKKNIDETTFEDISNEMYKSFKRAGLLE